MWFIGLLIPENNGDRDRIVKKKVNEKKQPLNNKEKKIELKTKLIEQIK